jgi:hypothetical protein
MSRIGQEVARFVAETERLFGRVKIQYDVWRTASQNGEWMMSRDVEMFGRAFYIMPQPIPRKVAYRLYNQHDVTDEFQNEGRQTA